MSRRLCAIVLALATTTVTCLSLSAPVHAEDIDSVAPYRLLRSLQFVQDTVVLGDHSAAEMQRFMLTTIDERLRSADPSIFQDPRNVDAALIYAMSGGNPQTLEFLVARDIDGNFDNRLTDALRRYLSGKGMLIAKSLGEMVTEYRNTQIAPYLALVAGNVTIPLDPAEALKFYDWARLTAPGTIVEEAALRRSLAVAVEAKIVDKASLYANSYARRFLYSPYASQFADLFVQFVVEHFDKLDPEGIQATLGYMDVDRQREVYLRMAREAAITGKNELAVMAADKAKMLSGSAEGADLLATLYRNLAVIPTNNVDAAMEAIIGIPDEQLSPRDRALRQAAEAIAKEVLREPELPAESPVQAAAATTEQMPQDAMTADDLQDPFAAPVATDMPNSAAADATAPAVELEPEMRTLIETGRSKLQAIDDLLKEEGP